MVTESMPPGRAADVGAPLQIIVTAEGQAWVGDRSVFVPIGTDPRVAVAQFVAELASRDDRDITAVFFDAGRGDRRRMIFTADGQILQSTRPLTDDRATEPDISVSRRPDRPGLTAPIEPAAARPAADDTEAEPEGQDEPAAAMTPEPPLDVDPEAVPAWPHFDITLLNDLHVMVNGVRHPIPRVAADPRAFAVGLAAAQLRSMGLARPVRATARDPDGTAWPILIHPGGAATEAGPPEIPGDKGRRGRRRADYDGYR